MNAMGRTVPAVVRQELELSLMNEGLNTLTD